MQQNTLENSQQALQQAVELPLEQTVQFQKNATELFLNGLEIGSWAQDQGLELTRDAFSTYIDTMESAVENASQATQELQPQQGTWGQQPVQSQQPGAPQQQAGQQPQAGYQQQQPGYQGQPGVQQPPQGANGGYATPPTYGQQGIGAQPPQQSIQGQQPVREQQPVQGQGAQQPPRQQQAPRQQQIPQQQTPQQQPPETGFSQPAPEVRERETTPEQESQAVEAGQENQ